MREAIERAQPTEYPLIALLGHPAYYPRFGFRPAAATFGITTIYDAPPEAWMALTLPAYEPQHPRPLPLRPRLRRGEKPHHRLRNRPREPLVERLPRPLRSPGGETSDAGEYGYQT